MLYDDSDREARADSYRESAAMLRRLSAAIRFDLCRRKQLFALAEGFDRLAARTDAFGLKDAAD
jgi:hypothetical protein